MPAMSGVKARWMDVSGRLPAVVPVAEETTDVGRALDGTGQKRKRVVVCSNRTGRTVRTTRKLAMVCLCELRRHARWIS